MQCASWDGPETPTPGNPCQGPGVILASQAAPLRRITHSIDGLALSSKEGALSSKHDRVSRATIRGAHTETDLSWLFCQSDAEVSGLRASHGALVEMAQTGSARAGAGTQGIPRRVQGITARQADAVDRQRGLRERFQQLSQHHQQVLWLAYGPQPWALAADERKRLGAPWHGVALVTQAARRGWAAERRARGERVGEEDARELVETGQLAGEPLVSWRRGADKRADVAAWFAKGLGHWLRGPAVDGQLLAAVRWEAERLVAEAWQVWGATERGKGKRRPDWDGGREILSRVFGSKVMDEPDENGDRVSETRVIVRGAFDATLGVELAK